MSEQETPRSIEDDELDVEELEEVAGGIGDPLLADGGVTNNGCPNNNCPC